MSLKRGLSIPVFSALSLFTANSYAEGYIAPPMVTIPGGSFVMGDSGGGSENSPSHLQTVKTFQLAKYAVTVAEFRLFAQDTEYKGTTTCNDYIDSEGLRGPTHKGTGSWDQHRSSYSDYQPVVCISWQDANAYAKWLSSKTGLDYRLPTEQEWEYAAKADTSSRYFWGDDAAQTQACKYGNFADHTGELSNNELYQLSNLGWIETVDCDDAEPYIGIVGLYRPNPFGLYDILGNVSEYTSSCYHASGYKLDSKATEDPETCEFIVHRGGNWHYPAQPHTTRGRYKRTGWNVGSDLGFRLALSTHVKHIDPSSTAFEQELERAQQSRKETREKLIARPSSPYLVHLNDQNYRLEWQPSTDPRVTGYDIYQSTSQYAHLSGGYFKKHYSKIKTLDKDVHSLKVSVPASGASYKVQARAKQQTSLPSVAAIAGIQRKVIELPGKINMHELASKDKVALYYFPQTQDKPASSMVFKTNKSSDKQLVSVVFEVNVKETAWYQFNYRGRSFHKGEFFKLWLSDRLVASVEFDPEIDDKTSDRHLVHMTKGRHQLELTVQREGFDRWGIRWLTFELSK